MSETDLFFLEKTPFKRVFDVFFSLLVLSIIFPLFIFIYLGIRLTSPGQALYIQDRLGKDGKIFKCYKFRTMHLNADEQLHELLLQNPLLKKEWEEKQKLSCDPRIFAFGHFLRKTSLDELPQFWNVLKGDLSIVGPRPYMVSQEKQLGSYARQILSVRPGITGLWQTSGRSYTSFHKRILMDATYVDHQSFCFDILLIIKTIPVLFYSEDAC